MAGRSRGASRRSELAQGREARRPCCPHERAAISAAATLNLLAPNRIAASRNARPPALTIVSRFQVGIRRSGGHRELALATRRPLPRQGLGRGGYRLRAGVY